MVTGTQLWLPLLASGALSVFSIGRWPMAWAAWLAPAFLLYFARGAPTPVAIAGTWPALFVALALSHRRALPLRGASSSPSLGPPRSSSARA